MRAQGDVLQSGPCALVTVLARLDVVPTVLGSHLVVRVGDRLRVFVAGDDAVTVEIAVAERVVGVYRVGAASSSLLGHVGDERVANAVARGVTGLSVVGAINGAIRRRPVARRGHDE